MLRSAIFLRTCPAILHIQKTPNLASLFGLSLALAIFLRPSNDFYLRFALLYATSKREILLSTRDDDPRSAINNSSSAGLRLWLAFAAALGNGVRSRHLVAHLLLSGGGVLIPLRV